MHPDVVIPNYALHRSLKRLFCNSLNRKVYNTSHEYPYSAEHHLVLVEVEIGGNSCLRQDSLFGF